MAGPMLLFGGTGMVGRNVVDLATERGIAIVAPRRLEVDLLDRAAVAACVRDIAPDIVVHAAGRVGGIEANMREPVAFLIENLEMGRNVVLAARDAGVPRLINLGSSCMYPKDPVRPLKENDLLSGPLEPTNEGYALAKIAIQRLAAYVSAGNARLQYKTLIPCNLYGRYDSFAPERSHLAAAAVHKLHRAKVDGARAVTIWGDGSARREFLYAGDLADAILAAVERFDSLPPVMNVGTGVDHSVDDYYRLAADVVGYRGGFEHDTSKPAGMRNKLMDTALAEAWGWRPATSLRDGLAATYAWYVDAGIGD